MRALGPQQNITEATAVTHRKSAGIVRDVWNRNVPTPTWRFTGVNCGCSVAL